MFYLKLTLPNVFFRLSKFLSAQCINELYFNFCDAKESTTYTQKQGTGFHQQHVRRQTIIWPGAVLSDVNTVGYSDDSYNVTHY